MDYIIKKEDSGKTLKQLLLSDLGLSYAFLKHLKFMENGILIDGKHATVRHIAKEGELLSISAEDTAVGEALTPTDIPLDIIYEDSDVIIPSKPPFMPTHPSHLHHGDTLADALAYRFSSQNIPFVFRPINRLDRNTSGLVIIAKSRIAANALSASMQSSKIKKHYIALLCGAPAELDGKIETYMRRTAESIIVRENCKADEGGDYALTYYKTLFAQNGYSLVLASPVTGRTHQLRVHFSGIGTPILGDDMYGTPDSRISRHALHATALSFPHPSDGHTVKLFAPLPDDIYSAASEIFGEKETARAVQSAIDAINKE